MTELSDRECGEIVAASLAPDRILSGIDGHNGSRPDVLLTTVDRILTDRLAAARAEGARDMRTKIETSKRDLSHIIHRFDCEWTDECSGPNFNDQRLADQIIAALLADGGEPQ